jgi:cell division protein FtsQ
VPTLSESRIGGATFVVTLDRALGHVMRPLANLMPRRLRRVAEKMERQRSRPIGQIAALGFLAATILYGLVVGGQIGRVGDWMLVVIGFGIEDVKITGDKETSDIAVLEQLDLAGSLIFFNVADAQKKLGTLPWVEHVTVRKFYPSTLAIEIAERKPFALWQHDGEVLVMDKNGVGIVPLDDSRFAKLPFMVGGGANETAKPFLADLLTQPDIASQMHDAVLVANRRWDLHLDNGVTVKLPEKGVKQALAQLVKLNTESRLIDRDVVVIDLRLPDRVTVRLPEGRSLEDVTSEGSTAKQGKTRT